jgi:hypothetical protein
MVWLYERASATLQIETRFDNDTREMVVVLAWPDGRGQVERFPDASSCRSWLLDLEQKLKSDRWNLTGPPALLLDGWPK